MHKFRTSKYKNSIAKCSKKQDSITDISVETPLCSGNHVAASVTHMACNVGPANNGRLAVFQVGATGRMGNHPHLSAHGGSLTDFQFSPFHPNLLLTASDDCMVKLWDLPDMTSADAIRDVIPTQAAGGFTRRPEVLRHNPIGDDVVAIATGSDVQIRTLHDLAVVRAESRLGDDVIQAMSWSRDGSTLACTSKDKKLYVVDPRAGASERGGVSCHDNHKDTRVEWMGEDAGGKLLTTGFGRSRQREVTCWDGRNLTSSLHTIEMGSSNGVLIPLFDHETGLLFVAGKGDSSLAIMEFSDNSRDGSVLTEASQTLLTDQTKGVCLIPKLGLDVMSCEVDRVMQLCARQLVPIKIEVPRRDHREFASELFPDTDSLDVVLSASDWLEGGVAQRKKTSLDPNKRRPLTATTVEKPKPATNDVTAAKSTTDDVTAVKSSTPPSSGEPTWSGENETSSVKIVTSQLPSKTFTATRVSKFRHWTGTVQHPSTHLTNLTRLSTTSFGTSNGFAANSQHAAFSLSVPGGHLAVVELSRSGRQPGELPTVENRGAVTDFAWDPFDARHLAVGLDTGTTKLWEIPQAGLETSLTQETRSLPGHYSRVSCVTFHPLASGLLATSGFDGDVIIWNTKTGKKELTLDGDKEEILHMSWSEDGKSLATVSKDSRIRVYRPRDSLAPTKIGTIPGKSRTSRIVWVLDDKFLFVSAVTKNGARVVTLHDMARLDDEMPAGEMSHDRSPSLLIPHYDRDSHVIFLTGKGDNTVLSVEVTSQEPHINQLAAFKSDQSHQAFSFTGKTGCDVTKVEFARAWRLSRNSIEPVSFKVPRVKMEYFQDDIFPPTRKTDQPTMTAADWLRGENKQPITVSLRPSDMKPLSEAPKENVKERKYESYNADTYKSDEQKRDELLAAISSKLDLDGKLEQDEMEGVDEDEWSD